jgi:hypothetical protein
MLGAVYGFGGSENGDFLSILLYIPAGSVVLYCGSIYAAMWSLDHWKLVKRDVFYKVWLVLQILVLLALLAYLV